jgi:citrate lyase beta subunit
MSIRLLYITKDPVIGQMAERAGVDWIFVDLEYRGKHDRQAKRDTVISAHTIEDVAAMRRVLTCSQLMVRINPIGYWSADEVNNVICAGADIVMLPFFKTMAEVKELIYLVSGRAKTCLLLETMDAVAAVDDILALSGIDFIHIGLNDLHIERKTTFMFEFLVDGNLDMLATKIRNKGITFGFGGMARIGELLPPAERILAEHYRLGSSGVILSRSFCHPSQVNNSEEFEKRFLESVRAIRETEANLWKQNIAFFEANRRQVIDEVAQVVKTIKERK